MKPEDRFCAALVIELVHLGHQGRVSTVLKLITATLLDISFISDQ